MVAKRMLPKKLIKGGIKKYISKALTIMPEIITKAKIKEDFMRGSK